MHDIKLLAIDIDGTLLTPQGQIAPHTIAAIQAAQEAGILVTLATARRYLNTKQIADALGLSIPLIMYDGAIIIQHPQGEIIHMHPLQATIAQAAVEILVCHAIQPVVHHITEGVEEIWTGPEEQDNAWIATISHRFQGRLNACPMPRSAQGRKTRCASWPSRQMMSSPNWYQESWR